MSRFRILLAAPLALTLALTVGAGARGITGVPGSALGISQAAGGLQYDIEGDNYNSYCAPGQLSCSPSSGDYTNARLDIDGPLNDRTAGKPTQARLTCERGYDTATEHLFDSASHTFWDADARGFAAFSGYRFEDSAHPDAITQPVMYVYGTDTTGGGTTRYTASTVGATHINSWNDVLLSGGFKITVTGDVMRTHYTLGGTQVGSPAIAHNVSMTCLINTTNGSNGDFDANMEYS